VTRSEQVAAVAGVLSTTVGSVAAYECARAIVSVVGYGESPMVASTAAIAHRRRTAPLYGAEWRDVDDTRAGLLAALCTRKLTAEETSKALADAREMTRGKERA
jgi:hypothetical protein